MIVWDSASMSACLLASGSSHRRQILRYISLLACRWLLLQCKTFITYSILKLLLLSLARVMLVIAHKQHFGTADNSSVTLECVGHGSWWTWQWHEEVCARASACVWQVGCRNAINSIHEWKMMCRWNGIIFSMQLGTWMSIVLEIWDVEKTDE